MSRPDGARTKWRTPPWVEPRREETGIIWIPVALALFGLGMTSGNLIGGRLADAHPAKGLFVGYGSALAVLSLLAAGSNLVAPVSSIVCGRRDNDGSDPDHFRRALRTWLPEAPTLMGAMNLAALNVANAIGAWAGGLTIAAGYGLMSAVWAGSGLTFLGLLVFALTLPQGATTRNCMKQTERLQ